MDNELDERWAHVYGTDLKTRISINRLCDLYELTPPSFALFYHQSSDPVKPFNLLTMDNSGAPHIAVFPWLAFGHMLPFLQLTKSLAKRGHRISFLSTPGNIQRLPKIPRHLAPLIDFVSLPPRTYQKTRSSTSRWPSTASEEPSRASSKRLLRNPIG